MYLCLDEIQSWLASAKARLARGLIGWGWDRLRGPPARKREHQQATFIDATTFRRTASPARRGQLPRLLALFRFEFAVGI